MNRTEIEIAVKGLVAKPFDPEAFPYELIAIYNASKGTVSWLKTSQTNAAKQPGDVLWKKHLSIGRPKLVRMLARLAMRSQMTR